MPQSGLQPSFYAPPSGPTVPDTGHSARARTVRERVDCAVGVRGAALMGVLNVTPDSFFAASRCLGVDTALGELDRLTREGADLIDIGAESSRPGAQPVGAEEQLRRLEPIVRAACENPQILVSVDTTLPEVAHAVLQLGAHAINDVSCLANTELARATAEHGAALIIMHTRGDLGSMTGFSEYAESGYADVIAEVLDEWSSARDRAGVVGMPRKDLWLDPGIGFAKNARQSLEVLGRLSELSTAGAPLVVGPSRKSFIASVQPGPPEERLPGTIAACLHCVERGASVLRVHDVAAVRQALEVARAIRTSTPKLETRRV